MATRLVQIAMNAQDDSALGRFCATPADVGQGDVPWVVLAGPEGNEFDVFTPR